MKSIILLNEYQHNEEARLNSAFLGPAGAELIRMLAEAGIITPTATDRDYLHRYYTKNEAECLEAIWNLHPEVVRLNVFNQQPSHNDPINFCGPKSTAIPGFPAMIKSKYVRKEFEHELDRLADDILLRDPNLIICFGNISIWALCGRTAISKIRGTTTLSTHTVADYKLLPTFHPSAILRQWDNRPTVIADLMKAHRESTYPEIRRPAREIWIEPSLADIESFTNNYILNCSILSVDIETSGSRITCIGFAPSADLALVIPFDDERSKTGSYWPTRADENKCWSLVRGILENGNIRKLFQNGTYDIGFLLRAYGIKTLGAAEDTMLLSHALQPESLKGLGYLGSIYSDEGSWKHMRKKHETVKKDD